MSAPIHYLYAVVEPSDALTIPAPPVAVEMDAMCSEAIALAVWLALAFHASAYFVAGVMISGALVHALRWAGVI
jgi:hypothetical protein